MLNYQIDGSILVVDDKKENIDIIVEYFREDYNIMASLDGPSALKLLEKTTPDIILLDVMMPDMDGLEVCRRIKASKDLKHIPIIFLTGQDDIDFKKKAFTLGAVDYVTKPFEAEELKARVNTHLALTKAQNALKDQNTILEEMVTLKTRALDKALIDQRNLSMELILRLSKTAEYRDNETGNHTLRVGLFCGLIAGKMGYSEDEQKNMKYASPFHDIGKLGIPDHILLKPGPLTAKERDIMQQHTCLGKKILENSEIPIIRLAESIAFSHHEKWDGSGYPRGLKGKEIPLEGRITAIVDVYDALSFDRVYRKALPREKCLEIVMKGRGSHFDPEIVDIFFDNLNDFDQIHDNVGENISILNL